MRWGIAALAVVAGCGPSGESGPERPATCAPAEVGLADSSACFVVDETAFVATTLRECGLASDGGTADCWWRVVLTPTTWSWNYSDLTEDGALDCAGNRLYDMDGELLGEWRADEGVLVWQGDEYDPACPTD